jgi:hypothetical protein
MGVSPLLLLLLLSTDGCSKSGLNSPATDGSLSDVPAGIGGSAPDGSGGTGGSGQGGSETGGWDPPPRATVRLSPAVLDFGAVDVGSVSSAQVVTVTVTGTPVALTPSVIGAGFAISATSCANPQPVGVCTISVVFAPTTIGAASGVLAVGTASVSVAGTGNSRPTFTTTDRVALGTVQINQAVPVVIQVAPSSAISMACVANGPDLTVAGQTCPASAPVTTPCTFTFTFKASTTGAKSESVVCTSGARVTQTLVTATVVAGASPTINPPTARLVSSVGGSDVITFTLANAGDSPTGELTAVISAGASDFSIVSNDCTGPLAPLAICKVQVAFKPSAVGARTGTLTVTDKASGQSGTAALTGTSVAGGPPAITPSLHDFGSVTVGAAQTLSFTVKSYSGTGADVLDLAGGSADFIIDGQTCKGFSLAPGGQCTFAIIFAPKSAGAKTAAVIVTQAGVATGTVQVTGTGVAAVIDAGTPDSNPAYAACFDCGKFTATPVGQTSPEVTCTGQASPPDGGIAAMNVQLLNSRDFAIVNESCTASRCTVTLVFKPGVPGRQVGTLSAVNMDVRTGCGVDFEATGL